MSRSSGIAILSVLTTGLIASLRAEQTAQAARPLPPQTPSVYYVPETDDRIG